MMLGKQCDYDNNKCLYEYFEQNIINNIDHLNKTAIIYKSKTLSYMELNETIVKINNYIYDQLIKRDLLLSVTNNNSLIGINLNPDEYTIPILLAINSLSFAYLPIDPLLPVERMKYIINDSKPLFIITNSTNNNNLKNIIKDNKNINLIKLNDILSSSSSSSSSENRIKYLKKKFNSKDNACVLYTSGSTGQPKGVMLSNYTIMNRINWQWDEFVLDESDIGAFKTSLNFVDHICEIFSIVLKGLPLCVIDPVLLSSSSLNDLIDLFDRFKITYFVLVPSLLKNILLYTKVKNDYSKLNSIKRWVCSGEQLTVELLNMFFDMTHNLSTTQPVLSNFYGSTEVTADITFVTFKSREQMLSLILNSTNVPIGYPIANSVIYLYDENMNLIQDENTIGEIYASGDCLANGYLNDIDGSTNKFLIHNDQRLFKTGDFGLVSKSQLYFTGRQDSQLKISGKRIDLNEIEFYSLQLKGIQSFIPLVYEHSSSEKLIIAFYKSDLNESTDVINKMICDHLKSCVYEYMIPKVNNLIRIDSVPLLYNGKIDKQFLKKFFKEKYSRKTTPQQQQQQNTMLNRLLEIIQNVTGINMDSKHFNLNLTFNELGISSLNSVEIYLELSNKLMNNKITFEQFIQLKTLNDLMNRIELISLNDNSNSSEASKPSIDIFKCVSYNFEKMSHLKSFRFSEDPKYSLLVLEMIADTFPKKNILHSSYPVDSSKQNLFDFILPAAECLKNSNTSFIVFDTKKNKFVGGSFLYDYNNTHLPCLTDNDYYLNLLKMLSINRKLVSDRPHLKNKKLLNASFMTTNLDSTYQENIVLINFIEDQIIKIATENNYDAIITINTTKLTKDLAVEFKGYVIEHEAVVNQFENNGKRVFANIPDNFTMSVCVKYLN